MFRNQHDSMKSEERTFPAGGKEKSAVARRAGHVARKREVPGEGRERERIILKRVQMEREKEKLPTVNDRVSCGFLRSSGCIHGSVTW